MVRVLFFGNAVFSYIVVTPVNCSPNPWLMCIFFPVPPLTRIGTVMVSMTSPFFFSAAIVYSIYRLATSSISPAGHFCPKAINPFLVRSIWASCATSSVCVKGVPLTAKAALIVLTVVLQLSYRVIGLSRKPIREGETEGWLAGLKKAEPELCLLGIIEICSRQLRFVLINCLHTHVLERPGSISG